MSILSRIFGSRRASSEEAAVSPSGVLEDRNGWYYEESKDYSAAQHTLRIEQDRPGDWYVHRGFCEVAGLNDPDRADAVREFFAGSYRWLELERDRSVPRSHNVIKVIGTYRDRSGKKHRVHLGYIPDELGDDLASYATSKLWGRIRFIKFPSPGRRPSHHIRFDLMVELDADTFD